MISDKYRNLFFPDSELLCFSDIVYNLLMQPDLTIVTKYTWNRYILLYRKSKTVWQYSNDLYFPALASCISLLRRISV